MNILRERQKTFDTIFELTQKTFPFHSQREIKKWRDYYLAYRKLLPSLPENDRNFFVHIEYFLASLKNSHTRLGSYPGKLFFRPHGYTVSLVKNTFILTYKNSVKGEIIYIDGQKPKKILAQHMRRISSSTKRYATQRALGFLLFHQEKTPVKITIKNQNKKMDEMILPTRPIKHRPQKNIVTGKIIGKNIEYIKIISWVDAGNLSEEIDKCVNGIMNHSISALIIDVRGNGGGDSRIACQFASHFFNKKVLFGIAQQRTAKSNLFKTNSIYVMPKKPYISAPIIILTDELCLSSNEIFIAGMRDNKRAVLAGRATGGGSGNPKKYNIYFAGKKFELFISRWDYFRKNGKRLEGSGIHPDVPVRLSLESLLRHRDDVLETAIKYVGSLKK